MDISLYIADLLDEHEYVIVPGLGAIISSYRPAEFSDGESTLLPPSRTVSFNPEMKVNDGLLIRYIAQQQKTTLAQASRMVEKYTGDIMYRLESGGTVCWETIGTLSLKKGKLHFSPAETSFENAEAFGLQPLVYSDLSSIPEEKEVIPAVETRQKTVPRLIWIGSVSLLVLIAVSLYIVFLPNHETVKQTGQEIQKDTSGYTKPEKLIPTDSAILKQKELVPVINDTILQHPRKELFYTIGGSFKSQQNANEYSEKMSLRGFHPIQLGLIGNFYLVALDTFFSADEAFKAADQYLPVNRKTEIWVYHPK